MTASGLIVGGTTSDAGKSLLTVGLCRWLARQGVSVAPFKAQNMSNNSMVVPGGAEIGRAQWLQAAAARVTPDPTMNPVLLKPGGDLTSHIVLRGEPTGRVHSSQWHDVRPQLAEAAFDALADLRSRYDVIIAEGAGSPAEINLRGGDFTNLGLARHAAWPMIVVGDIDKGGLLAAFYGTLAVCEPADQQHIAAWVVNKFRGHEELLAPGLQRIAHLTGRPVLGVIPYLDGMWVDAEDSLSAPAPTASGLGMLTVAVVRYPRISNTTDIDALAAEPGVHVTLTRDPAHIAAADLAVLPGSRETVGDLTWLHENGITEAILTRARLGKPVVGICGGYQMLALSITDTVESDAGTVPGLGLLPVNVVFDTAKQLDTPRGLWNGHDVHAYEIHHGVAELDTAAFDDDTEPFLDGLRRGTVWGTTWHGAWENDAFRRAWLQHIAFIVGHPWRPTPGAIGFAERRETMIETLADAVADRLDTTHLWELLDSGVPHGLPTRTPGFPA